MKKILIIAIAFLGTSSLINAQEPIRFGLKAGVNLTTLGSIEFLSEEYDYKYRPGFTAGLFAELPLGKSFHFIPEINYSEKGGNVKETVGGTTGELRQKVNYLDVPLAFSYYITPSFRAFVGPQVSFFLSQSTRTYVNGEQQGDNNTSSDDIAKTVVGGLAGLSYDLTSNLNLNARYMRDLQDSYTGDAVGLDNVVNSGFSFTLGYKF